MSILEKSYPFPGHEEKALTWNTLKEFYSDASLKRFHENEEKRFIDSGSPPPLTADLFFKDLDLFLCPYMHMVNNLFAIPNFTSYSREVINAERSEEPLVQRRLNFAKKELKGIENQFGILHAVMGFAGEAIELKQSATDSNFIEELGDCLFYLLAIHLKLQISIDGLATLDATPEKIYCKTPWTKDYLLKAADCFIDTAKRKIFYQQEGVADSNVWHFSKNILFCGTNGVSLGSHVYVRQTLATIIMANVAKLSKRYPEMQFSTYQSQQRLDKVGESE